MAARWLERFLGERQGVTIDEALLVADALAALGGPEHEAALAALRALAPTSTG